MSRLFSSLGADDAEFHEAAATASHDAEQRWPLFKAVFAKSPPPPLTEEVKQQRAGAERQAVNSRKRALTLPGIGHKLADSLTKLSGAPLHMPHGRHQADEDRQPKWPAFASRALDAASEERLPPARRRLFSTPEQDTLASEPAQGTRNLFAKSASTRRTVQEDPPAQPDAELSLASIFARLEDEQQTEQTRATGRPSIFGRSGKR